MKYLTAIKKFIKNHKKLVIFALLVFLVTAITNKYGPYTGKVVDAETGEPIEGAAVYMVFRTQSPNPGGSTGHYAGAAETLTDANGEFELSYRAIVFHPFCLWDPWPSQLVFKPGYGTFPGHKGANILPEKRKMPGIPEKQYVTISLPKLTTKEQRRDTLISVYLRRGSVPYKKRKHITELYKKEDIFLDNYPVGVK